MVVTGAVEGSLDAEVLRRICAEAGKMLGKVHGLSGKPALLEAVHGYNNAARYSPWIVLVDLDNDCDCAAACRANWLPQPSVHMCFRIAVRAIEAWLLSDAERIAKFLKVRLGQIPKHPDTLANPKLALVDIARESRSRSVRDAIVPRPGSGRNVGPLYTTLMMNYVVDANEGWRPQLAARSSESLARCLRRLREL